LNIRKRLQTWNGIRGLLENDSPELQSIAFEEKRAYLTFFEEIALLKNSKLSFYASASRRIRLQLPGGRSSGQSVDDALLLRRTHFSHGICRFHIDYPCPSLRCRPYWENDQVRHMQVRGSRGVEAHGSFIRKDRCVARRCHCGERTYSKLERAFFARKE
jgi:hypothetical protein